MVGVDYMSAAENKKLMQKIFEGLAKGDGSMFVEHLAGDATMTVTGQYSWSRTFTGKANIRRDLYGYVHSLLAERGKTLAFHFIADEDWVVVEARGNMVTKAGVPYQNHYCLLYRLEHSMIVEMKEYQDSALCERILGPYPAQLD
jgi:ketosteroid isomerase-like protein